MRRLLPMTRTGRLAAVFVLAAGAAAGCSSSRSVTNSPRATSGASGSVSSAGPASTTTASISSTTTTGGPAEGQTATTNPAAPAAGGAVVISTPTAGQTVASPLVVNGTSELGSIQVDLTDAAGNILASAAVVPSGGRFSVTLRFAAPPQAGTLTAYRAGPGGVHEDITQIPVRLSD